MKKLIFTLLQAFFFTFTTSPKFDLFVPSDINSFFS